MASTQSELFGQELLNRQIQRAQVIVDLEALLDLGIPLETARRLARWDASLDSPDFTGDSDHAPRETVILIVSRSETRDNSVGLDGAQLDVGLLYAVSIQDVPDLAIVQIEFFLDAVSHHTELSAPWDYDGTSFGGEANRVSFAAGQHSIDATITDASGVYSVNATFGVE